MTDCDGVLTDAGVYYSEAGEQLKRFNLRDGMGVKRLRLMGIDTGIVTGEQSQSLVRRAEKLGIEEVALGARNKIQVVQAIAARRGLGAEAIAYIGDDVNDREVLAWAGLSACPHDAVGEIQKRVHLVLKTRGGHGVFRELAEIILEAQFPGQVLPVP
ncbi:HAD family hydrolase [bacterium]|nr:HAD family hydrolase [bacterium]